MARLPDIQDLGARPVGQSRRRISSVRNSGAVGEAAVEAGGAMQRVGERIDEIRDEDDFRRRDLEHLQEIRVIRNEARAAQGEGAAAAARAAEERIRVLNEKALSSARSPRARRALEASITRRTAIEQDGIASHALDESTKVMEGSMLARRDAFLDEAAEAWDRPDLAEEHLANARSEIAEWGKWKGLSADQVALEQKAATSKVRTAVVQRKITSGDYDGALADIEAHRDEIGHEAENSLRSLIRGPMVDMAGETIVDNLKAMGGAGAPPAEAPQTDSGAPDIAKMVRLTIVAEGGGSLDNPKTSPKGARGPMQVMPGTDTDPGFGVKPMQANTEAERARVGRDYLGAMMKRYGNDPAKAWAAYNWGPGNVDAAIAKYGDGWFAHAPAETKSYVNANVAALGGSPQAPGEAPTGVRVDYASARAEINAMDLPYDVKRSALNALERRIAAEDRVVARREDDATKQALEVVEKLGDGFTNMSQIPADIRGSLPVQARLSLAEQAQRNAAPKPIPANGDTVLGLTLKSINDPQGFAATDLRLYRHQMTAAEFESLATAQARMRNETPGNSPTANLRSEIDGTIRFYARDIGLDVSEKSSPDARADYLSIFGIMQNHVERLTEGKRAPTDQELKAAFDRATMQVTQPAGGLLGGKRAVRMYDRDKDKPIETQIAPEIRERIRGAFRQARGRDPSADEMLQTYFDNLGRRGFW